MKTAFLLGAAGIALAAPAFGQVTNTPTAAEVEVIVVEATHTRLNAFEYPGMTSTISTETLDLARPSDLDDLLRQLPGLEIAGGPRRTGQTPALRGQGRENTTLLLDGARQNFGSAHDGALFVDPSLLVGVESVRGSASALYGSGASGGVISLRTASARDLLTADESWGYSLGAGTRSVDGETRGSASVFGQSDRIDILASVSHRTSGDITLGSGDDLPADDSATSGLVKLGVEPADGVRLELSWQGFDSEAIEPNNAQGVAGVDSLNALVEKDISSDNLTFNLSAAPAGLDWMDLDLTVYRNTTGVDEDELVSGRQLRRDLETTGLRADQRFAFQLGQFDAGLTVGGEYYEDTQDGYDSAETGGVRGGAPDASSQFTAGYTQLELTGPAPFGLPGQIILLPGIRHDSFETSSSLAADTSSSATSSRFAATWAPTQNFNVFASWGEGFRAPSINELYLDGTHFSLPHIILGAPVFISNRFIANPDLKPEQTETIEAGFSLDLADRFDGVDRLQLRAAWFETEATDLIDLSVDFAFDATCFAPPFLPCSAGTTRSANVSAAELSGYEAELKFAAGNFALDASLSDVDGEDSATGDPVGTATPVRLYLDGRWTLEPQRLTLGARAELAGDFDETTDPAALRDGYGVLDLYTRWQPFADRGLSLNAGVENVFDTDYERVFAGVSEPGRSLRFDLTWSQTF
ncbi:TonB-dependent receptor domain-containing protein [Maricaulis sp.]|uniref:TonB-dependent receptor domain-containing protein n=1 Tax=Maricaulis sp. TaxID=1486257 RepID=UPI003A929E72